MIHNNDLDDECVENVDKAEPMFSLLDLQVEERIHTFNLIQGFPPFAAAGSSSWIKCQILKTAKLGALTRSVLTNGEHFVDHDCGEKAEEKAG